LDQCPGCFFSYIFANFVDEMDLIISFPTCVADMHIHFKKTVELDPEIPYTGIGDNVCITNT
jgi:hypothetical protein